MSKYQPLSDRLAALDTREWRASFAEIEAVLGFSLPKSAHTHGSWWANTADKAHNRAWLDRGWRVVEVDRAAGQVVFQREPPPEPPPLAVIATPEATPKAAPGKLGAVAIVGGAVALAAGLGTLAVRAFVRRR